MLADLLADLFGDLLADEHRALGGSLLLTHSFDGRSVELIADTGEVEVDRGRHA